VAKLYIEIDTENKEDMKLMTIGRKGMTPTLEGAQSAIDYLAEGIRGQEEFDTVAEYEAQLELPMISRVEGHVVGVPFEVVTIREADAIATQRMDAALEAFDDEVDAILANGPLIISANHVGDDEKGN